MYPTGEAFINQQRKRSKPGVADAVKARQERALRWFTAQVPLPIAGQRIVDLGTRDGYVVDRLNAMGAIVEGIELVPEVAKYDRDVLGRNVQQGDMRETDYADGSWDMVFCIHSMEHVPDPDRVMAEIIRICKPGGWFMVVVPMENEPVTRYAHNCFFACPRELCDLVTQFAVDVSTIKSEVKFLKDKSMAGGKSEEILLVGRKSG
jgi:2-polyprenyl-3-methyl-5-hydroxy-6-metoxy-1,4-benzoquinol methylase